MEGMQAYGAGKAGGAFDPITFFQQPQTILRIVSWVSDTGSLLVLTAPCFDLLDLRSLIINPVIREFTAVI